MSDIGKIIFEIAQTTTFEILSLHVFRVYDVIKQYISPYFFKPQRLKYQLLAFLVHHVIKQFPVLFQKKCFHFFIFYFFSPTGNVISGQNTRKKGVNPVVHVHTQGNPFGVRWPSITCTTFCTTTLVRKKNRGIPRMRTRSLPWLPDRPVKHAQWSDPVAPPPQMITEMCPYTTMLDVNSLELIWFKKSIFEIGSWGNQLILYNGI